MSLDRRSLAAFVKDMLSAIAERICLDLPDDLLDVGEWDDLGDDPVFPVQRDPFAPVQLDHLGNDPTLDDRERVVMACGRLEIAAHVEDWVERWSQEQER